MKTALSDGTQPDYARTMDFLRRLCSAREYCAKDIYEKALKRLESAGDAAKAVAQLQEEGYQSDNRYASAFARDKAAIAGWGRIKIAFQLKSKGIAQDVVGAALSEIDCDKADEKLHRSLEAKYKMLRDDPRAKIKLLKFVLSRGYSYDEAIKALENLRL